MELNSLAQFLAPLLPYLLQGSIELAKAAAGELGKRLSADGWEGLKQLAGKIQKKAEAKPALQEALTDAQANPKDEDTPSPPCACSSRNSSRKTPTCSPKPLACSHPSRPPAQPSPPAAAARWRLAETPVGM